MRQLTELDDAAAVEAFLARLYVDPALRARFLADPRAAALEAGLSVAAAESLQRIDRPGLAMASRSIAAKRAEGMPTRPGAGGLRRLLAWLTRRAT